MSEPEENPKGFKVQDKRRFSAEGELKPEFRESAEDTPPPASAEEAPAGPRPADLRTGGEEAHTTAAGQVPQITFASFLVGLSTQALINLGEVPDPATGQTVRDLGAAQQLIDLIGILRDKTRGNLDSDEQKILDSILFDLRMKYVELARPSSA